jgi:hypothetical protein
MSQKSLEITPSTKVAELLAAYPELEDMLIAMAPPFKKLKNPVLRRSVARVASLRQAAAVAGLPVGEIVNALRSAVGHPELSLPGAASDVEYFTDRPDWVDPKRVVVTVDEREDTRDNEMPLNRVIREATRLKDGDVLELITTFLPAPGIDRLKAKGFAVWPVETAPSVIRTYVSRTGDAEGGRS